MVSDVEDVPAELKLMLLAPRHGEGLCEPKIHVRVSRQADVVAGPSFARISIPEALVDGLDIATAATEELWGPRTDWSWRSNAGWTSVNGL